MAFHKAVISYQCLIVDQRGRGHRAVYCTSPQSLMITYSYSQAQQSQVLFLNLIGWFIQLSVQTFQQLIIIYRRVILCISLGMYIILSEARKESCSPICCIKSWVLCLSLLEMYINLPSIVLSLGQRNSQIYCKSCLIKMKLYNLSV